MTEIIERHTRAMLAEVHALVAPASGQQVATTPSAIDVGQSAWTEIKRLDGQRYSWPPDAGGDEEYDPFVVYRNGGLVLALAHNKAKVVVKEKMREQIWVFHMGTGLGSKEPISPFIAADDYDETREMVSIIRGNGESRRRMFDPSEQLPLEYAGLKIEILGDRIQGHYKKLCAVAHEDDVESMLRHGAAQARLRRF
jgi:hypothetical protein